MVHGQGDGRDTAWARTTSGITPLLLAVLFLVGPLAYASPTDPTWIPGLYDAADYDDVIDLLTDMSAASHVGFTSAGWSSLPCLTRAATPTAVVSDTVASGVVGLRAPPARDRQRDVRFAPGRHLCWARSSIAPEDPAHPTASAGPTTRA
jgi:hypothetical protein